MCPSSALQPPHCGRRRHELHLLGGSPRRSFNDAKVQRLENIASDIAVGIAVLAAAKKGDHVRREEQAGQREEERRLRELALRRDQIAERRGKALDEVLDEMASPDRLRRLVAIFSQRGNAR